MTTIPLFDGERGELLNTWGGAWGVGTSERIALDARSVHSGRKALSIEFGTVPACSVSCFGLWTDAGASPDPLRPTMPTISPGSMKKLKFLNTGRFLSYPKDTF